MKEVMKALMLKLVGCPYIWGGANPWTGLDCSGFAIWVMQVFGILPSGDWTAQGLCDHLKHCGECGIDQADVGDLVFYAPDGKHIGHVMVALGGGLCVGASGGDAQTTTREIAAKQGAAVKVKPIHYRGDLNRIIKVSLILEALDAEIGRKVSPQVQFGEARPVAPAPPAAAGEGAHV